MGVRFSAFTFFKKKSLVREKGVRSGESCFSGWVRIGWDCLFDGLIRTKSMFIVTLVTLCHYGRLLVETNNRVTIVLRCRNLDM